MKLSQLQKKYPKAYYKFVTYFRKTQPKSMCQEVYEMMDRVKDYDVRGWWKEITDFMDKQGVIIAMGVTTYTNSFHYVIWRQIKKNNGFVNGYMSDDFKFRKQAETKAIEKAFQILEGRSKE
jgi:hypothetical protein